MRRSFLSLPRLISSLVVFGLCLALPKAHAFMCAASEPCKLNCTSSGALTTRRPLVCHLRRRIRQ